MDNNSELDYFTNLSSNEKSVRISSIKGILKRIKHNSKNRQHLVYLICKRLFRGLGASNPCLRQGCFSAVVGFLKLLPVDFDLKSLEHLIENELTPVGNNSKLEEGEAYLGQCLAYGSMIVSDFILHKSEEEQTMIFEKLFQISTKRSYLHHITFTFLTLLSNKTKKEYNSEDFLSHLLDLNNYTLDKLNYILNLSTLSIKTSTVKKVLETKNFYHASNASKIAVLLKRNRSLKILEHEFFKNFVKFMLDQSEFLRSFWESLCETKGFQSDGEDCFERVNTTSDLFLLHFSKIISKQCISDKNGFAASCIFNEKFINIILRNTHKDKKLIKSVLDELSTSLKLADDDIKLTIIKQILFEIGLLNFDNNTSSKTVLILTNSLSFNSMKELANEYKAVLEFKKDVPKRDVESRNKAAIICLNYLTKIINNHVCSKEIDWRISQLVYLLKLGYFTIPDIKYNRELKQCIQEAFLTSLGHRFPTLEDFHHAIEGIVLQLNQLFKDQSISLTNEFTEEMTNSWNCAVNMSKKMDKFIEKNPTKKEIVFVIKILLQYMAILLLKEQSTAVTNIEDLKNIYAELTEKGDTDDTMWIRVLIDLFLNLLSKPNYHHRHIIKCTFKFICPHLTRDAFLQIIEVLDLSYEAQDSESDDEDEDKEDEKKIDCESDEDESFHESSEEEDMEDESLSKNEKLRMELRNALGGGSDNESVDLDDMDEEEGRKLDETLSSIFRANMRKRKSNNLSKYENQLAHFRTRVMDLIEICTESVIPLSYWIKAFLPIVDLFGSTIGQSKLDCLRSRISCCIKKLNSAKIIEDKVSESEITTLLENLLAKLSVNSGIYAEMKAELVQIIKFILKACKSFSKGLKPKNVENNEIFLCVKTYFKNFVQSKNCLSLQLFNNLASIGWSGIFVLIPEILSHSFDENSKPYKKMTILKVFEIFIKTPMYFDGHLDKHYQYYIPQINELFTKLIIKEFNNVINSKSINNQYHSEVWSIIIAIVERQKASKVPEMLNIEEIKNFLSTNVGNFPSMKGKCKQNFRRLCNMLSINLPKQVLKANKIEANDSDSEINNASSKNLLKRKRKNDILGKRKKKIKTTKLSP